MAIKKIDSVGQFAGLLESIFLHGKHRSQLPMKISDMQGNPICQITVEDEYRWVETPYGQSFACTKNLCSKKEWQEMRPAEQIAICDCWEALAIFEYLHTAYDKGNRFDIKDYDC